MKRLRYLVKRTIGITMSVLLTISMMPVQAYALDTNSLEIDVTENGVTVNGEKADSPINKSDTDFDSVSIINGGYDEEEPLVPGGKVDVSVGNVDLKDEDHDAAIEIYNIFGENINTEIQSGNVTSSKDGIDIDTFYDAGSVNASVGDIQAGKYGACIQAQGGDIKLTTGDVQAETGVAYISVYDGNVTLTTGDVTSQEDGAFINTNGGNVTLTTGDVTAQEYGACIYAYGGNVILKTGDVTADGDGVDVRTEGGDVTLTTGSVQAQADGIYINGWRDDKINVSAGDIQADEDGIYVIGSGGNTTIAAGNINADGRGLTVKPIAAKTNIEINGDINSKNDAVSTELRGGNANIKVNGNITGGEGFNKDYLAYDGICIESSLRAATNMEVNGDVSGSMGVYVETYDSETNLTINGNVTGTGKNISPIPGVGIIYNYYTDGETDEGNDKLNMLVTDTVSTGANGVGVVTKDDGSGFKLTTWKITPSTNEFVLGENIVAASLEDPSKPNNYKFVENEEFEKSIQYIVKIDQTEVAGVNSLGATKGDGSALDKEGDYEWAHEGDTVLLKVELQDGYELANAYGKENQSYPFTKDASGNYYITVPRGGGIFISVETVLKPVDPDDSVNPVVNVEVVDDESSNDNLPTVQGAVADTVDPVIFNSSIIRMVADAAPGANVTVAAAGNTMISKEVVDTLSARPDVTLTITYIIDGVMYSVTIPAGTNLNFYRNAAGGIDIFTLVQLFGAVVIG